MKSHEFLIGRAYNTQKVLAPEDYLDLALRAEKYISSFQVETPDGIYWAKDQNAAPDLTFLTGSAGVQYFYQRLADVTGEEKFRTIAKKASDYQIKHWRESVNRIPADSPYAFMTKGLFGLAGTAYGILDAYDADHNEAAKQALLAISEHYQNTAVRDEQGVRWVGRPTYGFDGSIVLLLIEVYTRFKDPALEKLIPEIGRWYLSQGEKQPDGSISYNGWVGLGVHAADTPGNKWSPNFELGTAGAAYVLTRLYDVTGDAAYLEAAKGSAAYLKSIAVPQKKGSLIPYWVSTDQAPVFYLGNCHGPAGSSRFFYKLYELTGDQQYLDQITSLVDGLESLGAPEHQSAGFWNNYSICCGNAALVQFFLGLYQANGDARWHDLALRAGNVLVGEREDHPDQSSSWTIAFERIHPDVFSSDFTYNNGAAGIGCVLLQLYLNETHQFEWKRLPDDPFPSKPKQ